jgi:hypothetical protein
MASVPSQNLHQSKCRPKGRPIKPSKSLRRGSSRLWPIGPLTDDPLDEPLSPLPAFILKGIDVLRVRAEPLESFRRTSVLKIAPALLDGITSRARDAHVAQQLRVLRAICAGSSDKVRNMQGNSAPA